jgi:hypothetical protein
MKMQFQQVIQKRAHDPMFSKAELEQSLKRLSATKASIANLLKRAVQRDDLIRLATGIYCLPEKFRKRLISPFEFLMKVDPYSYVSDLTALSHLDLIPEAVGLINAFSEKNIQGQKPFRTEIGTFKFSKVPKHFLLFGVENVAMGNIVYRIATPLKAILDHAYSTKKVWKNRNELIHDLRIDESELDQINWQDLESYKKAYNNEFMNKVCESLNE